MISIHLMLLFNFHSSLGSAIFFSDFNTSNVTIQLVSIVQQQKKKNFNTSNVTIQLRCLSLVSRSWLISIHLMLLFNVFRASKGFFHTTISIHLMLLFNLYCSISVCISSSISIHLMLLFNQRF